MFPSVVDAVEAERKMNLCYKIKSLTCPKAPPTLTSEKLAARIA